MKVFWIWRSLRVSLTLVFFQVAAFGAVIANAQPLAPAPRAAAAVVGSPVTIYDPARDRCSMLDVADSAPRAFRDASGIIHFFEVGTEGYASLGTNLGNLRRSCRSVLKSALTGDPSRFADAMWLASFFTSDGVKIHGLVHNELRANAQPSICPSRNYGRCGYASLVAATSTDRGQSFQILPPPSGIVVTSPYRYAPEDKIGYMGASNILEYDGYYYLATTAIQFRAQSRGVCLMRTRNLDDPSSWRAWDGSGFTIQFVDPYNQANVVPEQHVCHPLGSLGNMAGVSLLRHVPDGTFIMIGVQNSRRAPPLGAPGPGGSHPVPWFAVSRDLIQWSPEEPLLSAADEARLAPINYPVLLDETSSDRNFSTIGDSPDLIYIHSNAPDDMRTRDVRYVRLRLSLSMP